jgi:hypothetical protein
MLEYQVIKCKVYVCILHASVIRKVTFMQIERVSEDFDDSRLGFFSSKLWRDMI